MHHLAGGRLEKISKGKVMTSRVFPVRSYKELDLLHLWRPVYKDKTPTPMPQYQKFRSWY